MKLTPTGSFQYGDPQQPQKTCPQQPQKTCLILDPYGCAGVIGAYSFLGPKAGKAVFSISGETADITFGAVTVFTGIVGTLMGGIALDKMGSGVTNALILCSSCTLFG